MGSETRLSLDPAGMSGPGATCSFRSTRRMATFHPERPYGSGTKCQILTTRLGIARW